MESDEEVSSNFKEPAIPTRKTRKQIGKRKKAVVKIAVGQKKKLAALVEQHPCLWSLVDTNHKNSNAATSAWNEISKILDRKSVV